MFGYKKLACEALREQWVEDDLVQLNGNRQKKQISRQSHDDDDNWINLEKLVAGA